MATCHYHPDRSGIGVCMRCRVVICSACCTRVDGVNHCHACLKALGQAREARPAAALASTLLAGLVLGALGILFFLLAWLAEGSLAP